MSTPNKKQDENIFLNFLTLLAVAIDALQGEKGSKGNRGEKGDKGDTGADSTVPGPIGPAGEAGVDGRDGKSGKDGMDGKDGEPGPQGPAGPQGEAGKDGKDAEAVSQETLVSITMPIVTEIVNKSVASKTPDTKVTVNYSPKDGDTNILPDDYLIGYTSGNYTATLPNAAGIQGQQFVIKNSGTGIITVTGNETIDGNLSIGLNQYDSLTVVSNGENYLII